MAQGGESDPTRMETNTSHQAPLVPEGVAPGAPADQQSVDKSSAPRTGTSFWPPSLPLVCLVTGVLGAGLFVAYANSRGVEWGEQAAVVAGIVFSSTLVTAWGVRHTYGKAFRDLGRHVAALREKPSLAQTQSCLELSRAAGAAELATPLQALAECYREALAQVVETQAALEALQSDTELHVAPPATERSPNLRRYPTFPFERSQRQMVGRLTANFRWQTANDHLVAELWNRR